MSSPSRQPGGRVEQASATGILRNHKRRIEILEALQGSTPSGTGGYMTIAEQFSLRGAWLCQEPASTAGTDSPEDGVHNTAPGAAGFLSRFETGTCAFSGSFTMAQITAAQIAVDDSVPMFQAGYNERRGFTHIGGEPQFLVGPGGDLPNCITFHPYIPWPSNNSVPVSGPDLPPPYGPSCYRDFGPGGSFPGGLAVPRIGCWSSLPSNAGGDTITSDFASGLEPFTISGWVNLSLTQALAAVPIWGSDNFSIFCTPSSAVGANEPTFDFIAGSAVFTASQQVPLTFKRFGAATTTEITTSIGMSQWVMLTCVYDGTTMSIYLNGTLAVDGIGTGNIASSAGTFLNFGFLQGGVGVGGTDVGYYLVGHMSGVLYFREALPSGVVGALYDSISLAPSGAGVFGPPAIADPSGLVVNDGGYLYFNTASKKLRLWTGYAWETVTSA